MVTQNLLTANDFNRILSDYFGRAVFHVSVTKTISNITGQETLTTNTPAEITAYFMRMNQRWNFDKTGNIEGGDAALLAKYTDLVASDSLIYTDGTNLTISGIDGNATTITVNTSGAHGLAAGDGVLIYGTSNYDGVYTVGNITDSDTFTIADTTHNLAAETTGQAVRDYDKFRVKEIIQVPGVFDTTKSPTYVYSYCNLFVADDSE